ncbi:MAG: amidohydrolase family protein [Campylobacterales bacterium]|nr:amidohydrolase family protein [Campylobacterales bacterium]
MLIKSGTVVDFQTEEVLDVRIVGNKIEEIGKELFPKQEEKIIDASGCYVLPGLIDLNFHIDDVASKKNEAFEKSIKDAYRGGITTVLIAPDCQPNIDDEFAASFILSKSKLENFQNILICANGTKDGSLNNVSTLFKSGVKAVSVKSDINSNLLRRMFQYTKTQTAPLFISPTNSSLEESGVIHDGEVSALMGLPSLPSFAESSEVGKILEVGKGIDSSLFIEYVTSKETIDLLKRSDNKDNITAGTPAINLFLCDKACDKFNTLYKTFPPLRSEKDKDGLIDGIKEGIINIISSNHHGIKHTEKDKPFELAENGVAVSAIYLQLLFTKLVEENLLSLKEITKVTSKNPADLLGLNKGRIQVGYDADLVILNPKGNTKADLQQFLSTSVGNIAMFEENLKSKVNQVFVMGEEVL